MHRALPHWWKGQTPAGITHWWKGQTLEPPVPPLLLRSGDHSAGMADVAAGDLDETLKAFSQRAAEAEVR